MTDFVDTATTLSPVLPRGAFRPLGLGEVRITGGFWGERQETNRRATLGHVLSRLESEGWLGNFDLAARGELPAGRRGREFADSEVYKYLEALAWEYGRAPDEAIERRFMDVVSRVAAAQEPDGYLHTGFGRVGQPDRWSDLEWGHELYCLGHLFQAAVAGARTGIGHSDDLMQVAIRAADLVWREFGPTRRVAVCGHPVIETGLAELSRVSADGRFLEQARLFVERRGMGLLADIPFGPEYFQDAVPVRSSTVLHGHAVRANYLAAGAVDVAVDTGDDDLLASLRTQWANTVSRRTYVTGGQGSHHEDEAFGADWELPSDRAYSETCAGIGSIMFSWRLLLTDGNPAYADLIERTLYNVVATSPGSDGTTFFYANPLQQRTPGAVPDASSTSSSPSSSLREPWFDVSCCPPNLARTLASLDGYLATATSDAVQIHQYAPAEVRTVLGGGGVAAFDIDTVYPQDGIVRVLFREDSPAEYTLSLRVPAWADPGAQLRLIDGDDKEISRAAVSAGYASIRRLFRRGDVVELILPMRARVSYPDPRIDAVRGSVAVERGPVVYALESVDTAGVELDRITVRDTTERDGTIWVSADVHSHVPDDWPYGSARPATAHQHAEFPLIPYHSWAERGPSTMRIWLPTSS